jgi:putative redox protein
MVQVEWKGHMAFEATPPSGNRFTMDAHPEVGGENNGPTPVEALLASIAACSGMDVISILKKKQQKVTSYRMEIEGERAPEGQWPRPFLRIRLTHIIRGDNLDSAAVARAVELSDNKYCSVIATLRGSPAVESAWRIDG